MRSSCWSLYMIHHRRETSTFLVRQGRRPKKGARIRSSADAVWPVLPAGTETTLTDCHAARHACLTDLLTNAPLRSQPHSHPRPPGTTSPPLRARRRSHSSCASASCRRPQTSSPPTHSTASTSSRRARLGTRTRIARRCGRRGRRRAPCAAYSCALSSTWP